MVPTGPAQSSKVLKNEKIRPVEVPKLAVGPEKGLILGQCGPEKFIWPAHWLWCTYYWYHQIISDNCTCKLTEHCSNKIVSYHG